MAGDLHSNKENAERKCSHEMSLDLFGTDGVRGVANIEPMTAETVLALGRALAHICERKPGTGRKILIGKDTRTSGYVFENALCAGICSMGMDVSASGPHAYCGNSFPDLEHAMRCGSYDISFA